MPMSEYETKLRGARKRLRQAEPLAPDPEAMGKIGVLITQLTSLIDLEELRNKVKEQAEL